MTEIINKVDPLNKEKNRVKCCLVKKNYHVKGEIIIIKREKVNNQFEIVFSSNSEFKSYTCNKIKNKNTSNKKKQINANNNEICYGSVFPSLNKEFNRKLLIKSKDIKFILIRNYYRRTSALEIFTYKSNKSYFFNFKEFIDLKNLNNIVLEAVKENENFKKYTFNKVIVYVNKIYESAMFPLFSDKITGLDKKISFYNNYDLLIIINLLSNRSFKDLYQYPILPMLYKPLNILENEKINERDLGEHLGIQGLSEKSRMRKVIIEDSYLASRNESFSQDDEEDHTPCLFNTHYSNPVYTCNYLIRIFPYSFSAIEYQGDGFDSPNRLFYSVKKTLENTLSQKSDLREMIPELFYFPDLYYNNNNLKFGKLLNDEEVDNVYVSEKNEEKFEKYKYISDLKNYLEFDKLKINNWINLIFGINQNSTKDKRLFFSKSMYIHFDEKQQLIDIKNNLNMQKYEFGIQPYQIFQTKFPEIKDKSEYFYNIQNYNIEQFRLEHSSIKGDKKKCFKCEGYNNIYTDYIQINNYE